MVKATRGQQHIVKLTREFGGVPFLINVMFASGALWFVRDSLA